MDVSKIQSALDEYARTYWIACNTDNYSGNAWSAWNVWSLRLKEYLGEHKYDACEALTRHRYKITITVDRSVEFTSEYPKGGD